MLSSEHLFAGVEVDRVKVHVVRSPGEPETRDRVEKLSGKSCAIVGAVEPPANRNYLNSPGIGYVGQGWSRYKKIGILPYQALDVYPWPV